MIARRMLVLGLALLAGGCGKSRVAGPVDAGPPPPVVAEVSPAPRSIHVPYTIDEVWARFEEPLDSTTVNDRNVFLKLDTRRVPIDVLWDAGTKRIRILPRAALNLAETYTVELGAALATAAHVALGKTYWWQFTVTGVRNLEHPLPEAASIDQSPYTPLAWDRTDNNAGTVLYDLYVDPDSTVVATRSIVPVVTTSQPEFYRRDVAWPRGSRQYWAVTARNLTLGEEVQGPVWSFDVAPPGAPVDSILIPAAFFGYFNTVTGASICNDIRLLSGSSFPNAMMFDVAALRPVRRIAAARIKMIVTVGSQPPTSSVWSTLRPVVRQSCDFNANGIPNGERYLAPNTSATFGEFSFASDPLTFHVAAMHLGLASARGYTIQSSRSATFGTPPTLVLYYYR